jgi:hypothetical protein
LAANGSEEIETKGTKALSNRLPVEGLKNKQIFLNSKLGVTNLYIRKRN